MVLEVCYSRTKEKGTPCFYHCLFEIRLCSAKERGNGRLGRVDTGLLARTLPSGTKEHANKHGRVAAAPFPSSTASNA